MSILASFWKSEACGQTVLPDRSVLIGQKLVENAKMPKIQMRHFEWFSNNVMLLENPQCYEMRLFKSAFQHCEGQ